MPSLIPQKQDHKPHRALLASGVSLATVLVLIVIKFWAYVENGSVSVLASLIDSLVDSGVSLIMFMAIRFSLKPADSEHRYGHGKIEGLAALFQAAFIAGAGFFLFLEAVNHFRFPEPPQDNIQGPVIVMVLAAVLSLVVTMIQGWSLKHAPSLAVEADKAHYSMDILINIGVIIVLLGLKMGAPHWLDPAFGLTVVVYLVFTVRDIGGKGMDMLLDRELPGDVREKITSRVLSHRGVMGMHDLRTHKSGMRVFMSFDIELDPSLLLYNAHEIVREVEHELLLEFSNAEILIHADPYGDTYDTRHNVTENA